MQDIAPELLNSLIETFKKKVGTDKGIKEIIDIIEADRGTYKDADDYAVRTGQLLSETFRENFKKEILPDGKIYYNIANRTISPMLQDNHKIVADICAKVQKVINEDNNLGLRAIAPELDKEYIESIIDHVTDTDDLDKVLDYLDRAAVSFLQNVVDDSVRENARFQSESGLVAKVYRHFRPGLTNQKAHHERKYWQCPYCKERECSEGVPYEEVDATGAWIWQRHPGCNCIIEYKPSRGFKQIVPPSRRDKVQKNLERLEKNKRQLLSADITNLLDEFVAHSLSAKFQNYDILNLETGERYHFAEGSKLQNKEVFAGKGSKKPFRKAQNYAERYGGAAENWQHVKAQAILDTKDGERKAEVHWSQCEGYGKHEFFLKKWLDYED